MKILARTVNEIQQELDEVNNLMTERKSNYDKVTHEYYKQSHEISEKIEAEIRMQLNTSLPLSFQIDEGWSKSTARIQITNERESDQALQWHYNVDIMNDETAKIDTGSWSGLDVTTPKLIDNLKESVNVFEKLSKIDWIALAHKYQFTSFEDIAKDMNVSSEDMYNGDVRHKVIELENELKSAELQEAIDTGKWMKLKRGESRFFSGGDVYIRVVSSTSSQVEVEEFHSNTNETTSEYRMRKTTLADKLVKPIQFLDK